MANAKLPLFELLFAYFRREHLGRGSSRAGAFRAYVAERGESLRLHALYDAIDVHMRAQDGNRYWGWPVWPGALRDPAGAGVREFEAAHRERVEYYAWLQWLADEQLGEVQRVARELGMPIGFVFDTPITFISGWAATASATRFPIVPYPLTATLIIWDGCRRRSN